MGARELYKERWFISSRVVTTFKDSGGLIASHAGLLCRTSSGDQHSSDRLLCSEHVLARLDSSLKDDGSVPYDLGPFQEQFRAYLDNSAGFPRDCALLVAIRTGKEVNRVTFAPIGERKDSCHAYKFPMPGLGLSVAVGRNIPRNVRNLCLVNGPGNPIVATSIIDDAIMQDAFRLRPS